MGRRLPGTLADYPRCWTDFSGEHVTDIRVATGADIAHVRRLFMEYAAWVGVDLSFQGFDRELAELPGDYVGPAGVLFVARVDGEVAGCVAAHHWRAGVCEMKRLFVRDGFRGSGCGRALVESVIAWARVAGYQRILLDTLPVMDQAQRLYARLGFQQVAPYRRNPIPGARFLELALE
jgi:GNAT superfamily N-acetyltransferase